MIDFVYLWLIDCTWLFFGTLIIFNFINAFQYFMSFFKQKIMQIIQNILKQIYYWLINSIRSKINHFLENSMILRFLGLKITRYELEQNYEDSVEDFEKIEFSYFHFTAFFIEVISI